MNAVYPELETLLLSDEQLAGLLEKGKGFAESFMAKPTEHLRPQIVVAVWDPSQSSDDYQLEVAIVLGSFDGQEKRQILETTGLRLYEEQKVPLAVMLLSECWRSREMIQPEGQRKYLLPEDDPNREEAIVVQLLSLNGKTLMAFRLVDRSGPQRSMRWTDGWELPNGTYVFNLLAAFYKGFFAHCKGTRA